MDIDPLIEEGLREARGIGNPVARSRHVTSWAFRVSAVDPARAWDMASELPDDPVLRTQFLLNVIQDRSRRGEGLEQEFAAAIELARGADPDTWLRVLNSLSEIAIELAERERETAIALLRALASEARGPAAPGAETEQPQALARALVGESLLMLGEPEGLDLLHEAERLSEALPARDAISVFLANAMVEQEPERALALAGTVQDTAGRLEARLQLAGRVSDPALRGELFDRAEEDALRVEHMRGPEALVRLGHEMAATEPERARAFFQRALAGAEGSNAQLRSLQWTGVASALASVDREWAGQVFQDAVQAAIQEGELVRRVTALVLIAGEMAASHPRDAAEVFRQAIDEAAGLEAMWEHAHLLDIIFREDRSPFLDIAPARALVEQVLSLVSDEDPRIPGVFGLPDAGRLMLQLDPERAVEVLQRWFQAAEAAGDSDGMTGAAAALYRADPEAGRAALQRVHDFLIRRLDCPAMGDFSRQAAPIAPDLVLSIAGHIPDRWERADAKALAALHLYEQDGEAALALVRSLEQPADRSAALLSLADRLLKTGDRPLPQPLLEDMP